MRPTSDAKAALACAALFLFAGCSAPRHSMIASGRHALSTGVPANLDGARITLASVADSRCPPDVTCIWPGRIEFRFELEAGGKVEQFALSSDAPSRQLGLVPATASLVMDSLPPVLPSQAPKPASYTITVDISAAE